MITISDIKAHAEQIEKEANERSIKRDKELLCTAFKRVFDYIPHEKEIFIGKNDNRPFCRIDDEITVCAVEMNGISVKLFRKVGDKMEEAFCKDIEAVNNFIIQTNILIKDYNDSNKDNMRIERYYQGMIVKVLGIVSLVGIIWLINKLVFIPLLSK